ncbi:MAG: hypothetical protein ACK4KW_07865 [Gemmobacter sp.]
MRARTTAGTELAANKQIFAERIARIEKRNGNTNGTVFVGMDGCITLDAAMGMRTRKAKRGSGASLLIVASLTFVAGFIGLQSVPIETLIAYLPADMVEKAMATEWVQGALTEAGML